MSSLAWLMLAIAAAFLRCEPLCRCPIALGPNSLAMQETPETSRMRFHRFYFMSFMWRLLGHLSLVSAFERFVRPVRGFGVVPTPVLLLAVLDDRCLRSFDRKYRVRTSGHIPLSNTSFDRAIVEA